MKYFQDFWNMLEFATLVMGIVAIAMYAMKKLFGALAMKLLEESGSGRCMALNRRVAGSTKPAAVPCCNDGAWSSSLATIRVSYFWGSSH